MKKLLKFKRGSCTFLKIDLKLKVLVLSIFSFLNLQANNNYISSIDSNISDVIIANNNLQEIITGTVTDNNGQPLVGATVVEKGTQNGVVTDFDGNFSIDVSDENAILVVSFMGYNTTEIKAANGLIISLEEDLANLEEVVVLAYGSKKKTDITGAVSAISTKDFKSQPITQSSDILQGRAAGVQVSSVNGAPGGGVKIRIRGNNSIEGNGQPLVVVDGFFTGTSDDLANINPNDIASVQVLKDASATALYGSRGSNGVIIVTTKKGKEGKTVVSFDSFVGVQSVPETISLLSPANFARELNTKRGVLGSGPPFSPEQISALESGGGTDWQNLTFRNAIIQSYQLSFSGKEKSMGYFVSGSYLDQDGIIINSGYKRYNLRSNLNFDISDRLKASLNMYASREDGKNNGTQSGLDSPVSAALIFDPTAPAYDENGIPTVLSPGNYGSIGISPLARMKGNTRDQYTNTINGNFAVDYEITNGLTYKFLGGARLIDVSTNSFTDSYGSSAGTINASIDIQEMTTWQMTNMLEYKKEIGNHKFSILGAYEQQEETWKNTTAIGGNIFTPSVGYHNLGLADSQSVSSAFVDRKLVSFLGRVDYQYANKYLLTASARYDGASVFAENNKWGFFPSVALGWRISNEDFLKDSETISNLKLRASYGATGNQAIAPYSSLGLLVANGSGDAILTQGSISVGVAPGEAVNPDLKWETTYQLDIGLDLGLFNGRLNFTADYYKKNTTDLLLRESLPTFTGVGSRLRNVGEIQNTGFEFQIDGTIINSSDFRWDSSFNIGFNESEVISLNSDGADVYTGSFGGGLADAPAFVLQVGEEVGNFYGSIYQGPYSTAEAAEAAEAGHVPGDAKYADEFGVMGNGQPKYNWGFNNTFNYKGLELNIFFQSVGGFDVWNLTRGYTFGSNADARDATTSDIVNQWSPSNESSNIAAYSATPDDRIQSSRFVEDGTFIRLKNLSLGYNFSPDILKPTKSFSSIKVYVSAQNVFNITDYSGYDPEVSVTGGGSSIAQSVDWGAYPNPRTFTFGLNINF